LAELIPFFNAPMPLASNVKENIAVFQLK
jgi:hypothetical protein